MTLPDLASQMIYGRLAWAGVLAALIASLLPLALQRSRRVVAGLLAAATVAALLPGQLSPAYWLALAFHWPSGLLLACSLLHLAQPLRPGTAKIMQPRFAALIATVGLVLYVDTMGLTAMGLYFAGFGALAPLIAAAFCVLAIVRGQFRPQAAAALAAVVLFSVFRLPSGNLWDALLDPLLWGWALVSLGVLGWRSRRTRRSAAANIINKGVGQW
jgi:hypothetical protein